MVKRSKAKTPANRETRPHYFQIISDARRKAKEEKAREIRVREEDRIREEVDRRWRDHMAKCPPVPIPRPPQPKPEPPRPTVAPDPATQEFLKWCFSKEEEEELPYWAERCPRIYGRSK